MTWWLRYVLLALEKQTKGNEMNNVKELTFTFNAKNVLELFVTARMEWHEADECWDFVEMEIALDGYGGTDVADAFEDTMVDGRSLISRIKTKAHMVNDADVYY